ncbi:hypothetical protein [Streptomyces sp. NPDC045470]|uniref:hypothetical protein n=1 Tax=Streptomyces sp. NPDC045470 TaxID=3155469 RepID=UPI0033CF5CD7
MSRRYRIARTAGFAVHNVLPLVVFTGVAVAASLVPAFGAQGPSDLVDLRATGGTLPLLAALAVLTLWWLFAEPWVCGVIERWYLDGAPPDEWLAYFGLEESWRTPSASAADFRQAHGDPAGWDATDYEVHQNLAPRPKGDGGARDTQD